MLKNSMESVVDFMAHNLKSSLLLNLMFGMLGIENYLDLTPATRENLWNITRRIQEKRAKENRVHGDFIDTLAELTKGHNKNLYAYIYIIILKTGQIKHFWQCNSGSCLWSYFHNLHG